jgi:hypothetical protein
MELCTRAASKWLSTAEFETAQPASAFRPMGQNKGPLPPPFTSAAPPTNSHQPTARGRTRCCQGASPEPKEMIETGWVERGSLRRAGDGEELGGEVDNDGRSDKRLLATKVWM